ncbi:MAG: hypothetical protein GY786_15275 [Proteobacteria bacterium]|nr:hypothetical protein [Pseudomonadota bacterium]
MKGFKVLYIVYTLLIATLIFAACKSEDTNTCEQDKLDENWGSIVSSSKCSADQKGEAYLALGGFDYFKFATNPDSPIASILGIDSTNDADTKLKYFNLASDQVKDHYKTGSDTAKSIFFFASLLGLYTYSSIELDNGDGTADTAFDGQFSATEIEAFTGSGLSDVTGDGTDMDPSTDMVQFKPSDGNYYLVDFSSTLYYRDTNGDGLGDIVLDPLTDAALILSILDPTLWTEANRVVYLNNLTDPFAGGVYISEIRDFINELVGSGTNSGYLENLKASLLSLGLDSSSDSIETINSFQSSVDNGATCSALNDNPGLRIMELIINKTAKDATSDYSNLNVFSISDLVAMGETDVSGDADEILGYIGNIGAKMLFKQASGNYVPNWGSADTTSDCCSVLTTLRDITSSSSVKDDGEITTSELICLTDTL